MSPTTFIYILRDPRTGDTRYVGKADHPPARFRNHLNDRRPSHKRSWIESLSKAGIRPQLEIIDEVPEAQWKFWESEYIRVFRAIGFDLVNHADGGQGGRLPGGTRAGASHPMFGRKHTPESRGKMSSAKRGTSGGPRSAETCEAISLSKRGDKHPMFGKHHTVQTRGRMSSAQTRRWGRDLA